MRAAKENDATTAEQHSRESVRIARTTRELLKKFAGAYHQQLGERNGCCSFFPYADTRLITCQSIMIDLDLRIKLRSTFFNTDVMEISWDSKKYGDIENNYGDAIGDTKSMANIKVMDVNGKRPGPYVLSHVGLNMGETNGCGIEHEPVACSRSMQMGMGQRRLQHTLVVGRMWCLGLMECLATSGGWCHVGPHGTLDVRMAQIKKNTLEFGID